MVAVDKVSILILSFNGRHHLEHCLPALAEQEDAGVDVEILVLDNGSSDKTSSWTREHHPEVRLIRSEVNLGFCGGNNHLARNATGDALILLNDDTRPEPSWLRCLVSALRGAEDDVGAVSGLLVDWSGERLDFGRGVMTFDGHAFQRGYWQPLEEARKANLVPKEGEELLFACGGNMLIRRHLFEQLGGFDDSYFAYLEDVDLGWRLWAAGFRVLAAPLAVARHRSMATSEQLGNANRGFLFERNAFVTIAKNLDEDSRSQLMPAVWMTLVHRTQTLMVQNNPGGELLTLDPYAGLIANTASPESLAAATLASSSAKGAGLDSAASSESAANFDSEASTLFEFEGNRPARISLADKWRGYGGREFVRRGLRKAARLVLPKWLFSEAAPATRLVDARSVAHLRAITWLLGHLEEIEASRRRTQAHRQRSDREIFERFPLAIVATYPGDERLFATAAFEAAIGDVKTARYELDEMMARDD